MTGINIDLPNALPDACRLEASQSEREFYAHYEWCLNPYISVEDALGHLQSETARLGLQWPQWQTVEIATNIFLLGGGVFNAAEEQLRGPAVRLPTRFAGGWPRRMAGAIERIAACTQPIGYHELRPWRDSF